MQRQQSGGRTRALLFLAGSVLLGLVAVVVVWTTIAQFQKQAQEARQRGEDVKVIVAIRDLYMGLPIGPDDVIERDINPDMIDKDHTFASLQDVLGRTPRERILANEVVREERLARPDAGIGLNAIIRPGQRAMTIATDTETAVAGLLQSNNYVDIIVTIRPEDPNAVGGKWVSETILQGIRVLAVGSNLGGNEAKEQEKKDSKKGSSSSSQVRYKPSITLEVTPEEAEKLALADSQGDVHVVLRSDIDILQFQGNGPTTTSAIIGYEPRRPGQPEARGDSRPAVAASPTAPAIDTPPPPTAEIISGSKSNTIEFGPNGGTTQKKNK
jgi:pilus assembly protein CpaB